jgi:ADP-ribose pyrophosphatase
MKVNSYTPLSQGKWLNLFDVSYTDRVGHDKHWQVASRAAAPKCITGQFNPPDAVIIVPYHESRRKLVLIREYRVPLGDFEFGFPAGLIEKGETSEAAAQRELYEETGLRLTRFIRMSPPVYSSAGMTDESVVMAYVACEGEATHRGNSQSEQIEVLLLSPDEAGDLCRDTTIKFDVKSWLVTHVYATTGRI